MKKFIPIFGVFIALFAFKPNTVEATHLSGGNFYYECLGNDSFLIQLTLWRDCSGISAPGTTPVTITGCNTTINVTLQQVQALSAINVSQVCPADSLNTTCNNGTLPGVEEYLYEGIVVLTPPCANWTMSWSLCCRNGNNIANIPGSPTGQAEATLDNLNAPCGSNNRAPVFGATPIPYACEGQQVNYTPAVTEADGDSLVFAIVNPVGTTYAPPASLAFPFGPAAPVTINPNTGQITFTPSPGMAAAGPFWVLNIEVCEYRNGVPLGCVYRDFQFAFQVCSNVQPWMTSNGIINFTGDGVQIDSNTVELCVGNTISFDVTFADSLTPAQMASGNGDSITITSNAGAVLPGAIVTATNGNPATFNLQWTATPGVPNFNTITVNIQDDACPIPGVNSFVFVINVIPATFAGPDFELCEDDTGFISVVGGSQFTWTVLQGSPIAPGVNFSDTTGTTGANIWVYPNQNMVYRVESNLSSTCNNADTIAVTLFSRYDADFFLDTPFCVTDIPDTAIPVTTNPPGTWTGPGIIDGQVGAFDPGVAGAGSIPINYEITSGQGNCNTDTTIMIEVIPLPDPTINPPLEFCYSGGPYNLNAATGGGEWIGASVTDQVNGVIDPGVLSAPGSTPVIYELTTPCFNRDTVDILFYQNFEFDLVDTPLILCSTDTASLNEFIRPFSIGPVSPNPAVYTWNGPGITNADSGWFDASTVPGGLSEFMINVTAADANGDCETTKSVRVIIEEPEVPSVTGPLSFCSDVEQAAILTDPPMKLGNWAIDPIPPTMDQLSFDPNRPGRLNPENAGAGEWEFTFTYTDINGCVGTLTDTIRILDTPEPPELEEYNFCVGDLMNLEATFTNHPDSLIWYEADENLNKTDELDRGTPYLHGIASAMDEGTAIFVTERNGVCESAPTLFEIPIRPRPNAEFTVSFTDSMGVDQTVSSSSAEIRGRAPFGVELEAVERHPDDASMNWDLWFDCDPSQAVEGQPCPWREQGYTAAAVYEKEGIYNVRYIKRNEFGCADTVDAQVNVLFRGAIPNVFTPNADGVNDRFFIPGATELRNFNLSIYNRWGRKVADINDAREDAGWDGGDAPTGTYFFIATGTRGGGEEFVEKGHVTLLRND